MKYDDQIEILHHIAGLLQDGNPMSLSAMITAIDYRFADVQPRPETYATFIDGAMRRGWLAYEDVEPMDEPAWHLPGVVATGQLWMFERKRWAELGALAGLRESLDVLVQSIVQYPPDVLIDMDGFAPSLTLRQRRLAWDVLLAAAPGLAAQVSAPKNRKVDPSKRVRLSPTMIDATLLRKLVDIPRDQPPALAMPLEVTDA